MAPKRDKGKKLNAAELFTGNKEENLDWAAGHNYDEADPAYDTVGKDGKPKSPSVDDRHVAITKAASFGNFRDESARIAGVPDDMPPPYVAFVKTFGRTVDEALMRTYFPDMDINDLIVINTEKALYAFIEFETRDDLRLALNVTGAKMNFAHPCTVDVASPSQIDKFVSSRKRKEPRSMRSPKTSNKDAPQFNFDRESFQTGEQPDANFDENGDGSSQQQHGGRGGGRGGRSPNGGSGGFRGMPKSGSANFDQGRDSIFGSAEPVPPPNNNNNDDDNNNGMRNNNNNNKGKFGGSRIATSVTSAEFSRESLFATREATNNSTPGPSPQTGSRAQFGRNASNQSIDGASSEAGASSNGEQQQQQQQPKKDAPVFSREMFGATEVPVMKTPVTEKEGNASNGEANGDAAPAGERSMFGARSAASGGRARGGFSGRGGNGNGNSTENNNNNNNANDRFSRRGPTAEKDASDNSGNTNDNNQNNSKKSENTGDVGDRFANFRSSKKDESAVAGATTQKQAPPPPPPAAPQKPASTTPGSWREMMTKK